MDSPRLEVECGVWNCQYNKNNMCYANTIKVNSMGDDIAETTDGTCCSTFTNRVDMCHTRRE